MEFNLFNNTRVKRSVALFVTAKKSKKKTKNQEYINERCENLDNIISWCFVDYLCRAQYEFKVKDGKIVGGVFDNRVDGEKSDVYTMFVLPNAEKLLELIEQVTYSSARRWLAEDNKRLKQWRK